MLTHHDGRDYKVAASEAAKMARSNMEAIIAKGRHSAIALQERILRDVPDDMLVRGRKLRFGYAAPQALYLGDPALTGQVDDEGLPLQVAALLDNAPAQPRLQADGDGPIPQLVLDVANKTETVHAHALGQMAGKAGVPSKYINDLVHSPNEALRNLALDIMRTHYAMTENKDGRYLLRSVGAQVRGFLSDRYRRLDNRPLIEAFAEGCQKVGALPVDGTASDTRIMLKAYLPMVFEPVPDEVMLIGLAWGNSDFGAAAHTLSLTLLRLWCTNKAVLNDCLRTIHLGRRFNEDDDIKYSDRTYLLDTEATASALKDAVEGLLAPERVNAVMAAVQKANEQAVDWTKPGNKMRSALQQLTKAEQARAAEMFDAEQDGIVQLPKQKTVWRASNVISWMAGQTSDDDRRLELERAAGELLDGFVPKAA